MRVWIDGKPSDGTISVSDFVVLRGDGCFEALRSYSGAVFAINEHLDRLARSVAALHLDPPDMAMLRSTIESACADVGDGVVRVVVTRGNPLQEQTGHVIVIAEPLPEVPAAFTIASVIAPWHSAGRPWALAGAKTTSYAPNLAATRAAQAKGADDAILLSDDGTVLEGPTFTVAWIVDGRLETPALDLLILDSITRRYVLRAAAAEAIPVVEGRFPVERLLNADEAMVMSTIKEVSPVIRCDDRVFSEGPLVRRLATAFRDLRRSVATSQG